MNRGQVISKDLQASCHWLTRLIVNPPFPAHSAGFLDNSQRRKFPFPFFSFLLQPTRKIQNNPSYSLWLSIFQWMHLEGKLEERLIFADLPSVLLSSSLVLLALGQINL
jgi:hypothetical protein